MFDHLYGEVEVTESSTGAPDRVQWQGESWIAMSILSSYVSHPTIHVADDGSITMTWIYYTNYRTLLRCIGKPVPEVALNLAKMKNDGTWHLESIDPMTVRV